MKNRIQELEKLIIHHKSLYYSGRPEISDVEYDKLEAELQKLDKENSVLNLVGTVQSNLEKVKHDQKMLSLDKVYTLEELMKWVGTEEVVSTFKVDGVSCSLIYEGGHLVMAKTRGDGSFGENITEKVRWIEELPKSISHLQKLEIRGELYTTEESFFHLSEEMVSRGLEKPTSQRNIVAGLMGRKESIDLCRYINFMGFDILGLNEIKTEIEKEKFLKDEGFSTPKVILHKKQTTIEEVIENAREFMSEGDYQIDGLVFTYNNILKQNELGNTSHHPRYKMAFKFMGESKNTKIIDITWQISRNGILTPVAEVEPVDLSGAMISRVTLHNYGMVKQYDLKIEDEIEIIRSGEVIPKFLSVVKSSNNKFKIPTNCPSCESKVEIRDIRLFCLNDNCPGKNKETILNFIVKIGIEDLSSKRLDELMSAKLVKTIPDLYRLTVNDFMGLDKVKEKLAEKLFENIQKTKKTDLITFLSSLGISGGAYNKCEKVVHAGFDTIEKILDLTFEKLNAIDGFAEKSAEEFLKSLKEKHGLIKELLEIGFEIKIEEKRQTKITDKKICITGALSEKRSVIEDKIRECGGVVVGSVSKNTDYLLTNETDPSSSKFKKALDLKISIITENEFFKMIS